ncbi:diguanylate cyclase [Clostridium botulinum]|uniref:Dinitrogenase iron-molybdenum cofactor family protein n=1 Tax=Clostridium botulinum D str. 1873 TaxID=592027 RepID=A0A9P2G770_CLOBO|nr:MULTISPECIES: NifB/NifX family molybdenum-iron cluster-binding protein [Clostridium]AYF53452.1 diguanylate cyclase [Clostridium novyi]EES91277.1 dinitrogenase iron-molybdenum cofactor family protein [Clostridium botulinum D str. 1873]MBO3441735.1 NifB/NifX family molybdenum-iron cluster-binding protein [Clostridium haemolyticum]MCD3217993.1 diguanylate cyclase [Clostridium botulinum C]NFV47641.1 diguanylate cyclase [Clostridium botulinum]
MKIAVSSTGKELKDLMDDRFGRCTYFVIYDSETNKTEFIENEGHKTGAGAGIAAAQQILDEDINIIITGYLGPNAFDVFEGSDIEAFKCSDVTVQEAIELYRNNKLEKLEYASPARK